MLIKQWDQLEPTNRDAFEKIAFRTAAAKDDEGCRRSGSSSGSAPAPVPAAAAQVVAAGHLSRQKRIRPSASSPGLGHRC